MPKPKMPCTWKFSSLSFCSKTLTGSKIQYQTWIKSENLVGGSQPAKSADSKNLSNFCALPSDWSGEATWLLPSDAN